MSQFIFLKIFHCLFLTTILIVLVTGRSPYWFSYKQSKQVIFECIEDYLFNHRHLFQNEEDRIVTLFSIHVTNEFYTKTYFRNNFYKAYYSFIQHMKNSDFILFKNDSINAMIEAVTKDALINCADTGPANLIKEGTLFFVGEPREIGVVLDYILVDWPVPLRDYTYKGSGRALLRRYADEAYAALDIALNFFDNLEQFRVALREYWMCRARLYFDGRNPGFPYILHRYTIATGLRRYGNLESMIRTCREQNFDDRNPRIPQTDVDNFLDIHYADRHPYVNVDIFAEYERNGMTSAESYLETHIDQFYKIIFFNLESRAIGIRNIEEDIYVTRMIPYEVLSEKVQEIMFDDHAYQSYLLSHRLRLQSILNDELLKIEFLDTSAANTTISTLNTTTPKYDESKRKGSVYSNDGGKHFLKRPRTTFSTEDQQQMKTDYGYMIKEMPCDIETHDLTFIQSLLINLQHIRKEITAFN